jgi:hypothetical protein
MEMWAVIVTCLSFLFRWIMPKEFGEEKQVFKGLISSGQME